MIYLLEDDDSIRDFVIYTLNSQGMEARGFGLPSDLKKRELTTASTEPMNLS